MPVSDDIRAQRESIKNKGFKYKMSYYWEYYRKPVAIIAVIAIMVLSIIKSIVTAKDPAFSVIFINSLNAPDATEFEEVLGIDTKKYMVSFEGQYKLDIEGGGMDETTYVNSQKLVAMVSAKSLDVITGDEYSMKYYAETELLGDLRNYFTEAELSALSDKVIWCDVLVTDENQNESVQNIPVLIDITGANKLVENNCYFMDKLYMGVIINTSHVDEVKTFYNYLTE